MSLGCGVLYDGSVWAELMKFAIFVLRDYLSWYLRKRLRRSLIYVQGKDIEERSVL